MKSAEEMLESVSKQLPRREKNPEQIAALEGMDAQAQSGLEGFLAECERLIESSMVHTDMTQLKNRQRMIPVKREVGFELSMRIALAAADELRKNGFEVELKMTPYVWLEVWIRW